MKSLIKERYEILRPLGKGGGGTCYLASDRRLPGANVALKAVSIAQADAEVIQAFQRECDILKKLNHPNLARLLDFGRDGDLFFYTSEYVEGSDFVRAARTLDWNAVFSLVVQGAWGLAALHAQGIQHRDIKPGNLLVGKVHVPGEPDRRNRLLLKIIDFGLAVPTSPSPGPVSPVGTLPYLAPEILARRPADHRADLYAFGVVIYEMALGKLPFAASKNFADLLKNLTEGGVDLKPLEEFGEIPRGILALLKGLLARDPSGRLKDSEEIIRILNQTEGENFPTAYSALDRLPAILEGETPAPIAFSAATDEAPAQILEKTLQLVRSGKRRQAWEWAEAHWEKMAATDQPDLQEKFFGAALHALIEQGEFPAVTRYLRRAEAHPAFSRKNSLENWILRLQFALRQGRLGEAERVQREIPQGLLKKAEPENRTRWENYSGLLFQAQGRHLEAAARFERAAGLAEKSGRGDHRLSALINAAGIYQERGNWKQAFELYRQAEALARELGHRAFLANTLNNLGNLYLYFGRHAEAEASLEESLKIARVEGLRPLIANNLYLITVSEEAKGNWERVQDCLQRAQQDAAALGEAQPILQTALAEAYYHLGRGEVEATENILERLRGKAREAHSPHFLLQADWLEAKLRIHQGRVDSFPIQEWLQAVAEEAQKKGSRMTLWQVESDRGDYLTKLGRTDPAREAYVRALGILEEMAREIPEGFQNSFFRDRKKERVRKALESLRGPAPAPDSPGLQVTQKTELIMTIPKTTPPPPPPSSPGAIDFQKWTAVNRRLLLRQDVDSLLEEILDAAIELTDAERGFVILSERQALDIRAARNFERESLAEEEERISHSIAREVMKAGETTVIFDAQTEDRFAEARSVHALNLRSVLCVPLRSGPRTIGLVYLDNRYRQGVFRPEHLPLVEALADQASLTLEHAKLHRENRDRIEELKKSQALVERLNSRLEEELKEKTVNLEAMRENLKRQNQETALRYRYDKIIGRGAKIRKVLQMLDRVVDSTGNVFIHGESGTGKELIAQAIHYNGPRRDFAFVSENCSAIPENLLESELFGHVKGAFTGADRDKVGLFQMAHRGTLFLDEVGDMPLAMQAKLLRILQEGEVRPVGGKDYLKVDVRVLAASHRDLKAMVEQGKFRQDLYFRLHVLRIDLPPLRERREDIPLLLEHFLKQGAEAGGPRIKLTKETLQLLMDYPWPGNIRELQNEVQRLLVLGTEKVTPEELSPHILEAAEQSRGLPLQKGLDRLVGDVEKRAISEAMERFRGNKVKVAKALRIGRRTLYAKLELFGIPSDFGKG